MCYITYLNWKFDKYSTDSIKYFKVSSHCTHWRKAGTGKNLNV